MCGHCVAVAHNFVSYRVCLQGTEISHAVFLRWAHQSRWHWVRAPWVWTYRPFQWFQQNLGVLVSLCLDVEDFALQRKSALLTSWFLASGDSAPRFASRVPCAKNIQKIALWHFLGAGHGWSCLFQFVSVPLRASPYQMQIDADRCSVVEPQRWEGCLTCHGDSWGVFGRQKVGAEESILFGTKESFIEIYIFELDFLCYL